MNSSDEITRYLSASLHRSNSLRHFIKKLLEERYKAINFSFGVDYDVLLKHYWIANKKRNQELIFFFGVYLFASFIGGYIYHLDRNYFSFFIAFIAITWIFSYLFYYERYHFLVESYNADNFDDFTKSIKVDDDHQLKINRLLKRIDGNVCYYGGASHDENLGYRTKSWSFAIDLEKEKSEGSQIINFNSEEIYEIISRKTRDIFPNFQIKDILFCPGNKIRHNRDFLPDPFSFPTPSVSHQVLDSYKNNNDSYFRHYKTFQLLDWRNELALTFLLKIKKTEKYIFIESSYLFFPPIKKKYKEIDELIFYKSLPRMELKSAPFPFEPFFKVFTNLYNMFVAIFTYSNSGSLREEQRTVKNNYNYNYGEAMNLRKFISSNSIKNHFVLSDLDEYTKIFEKRLLDIISDFLDKRNIDVSEFKKRENNILNNGIIITGGQINTENLTVGKKSKVKSLNVKSLQNLNP